jgi:hypothetical protein
MTFWRWTRGECHVFDIFVLAEPMHIQGVPVLRGPGRTPQSPPSAGAAALPIRGPDRLLFGLAIGTVSAPPHSGIIDSALRQNWVPLWTSLVLRLAPFGRRLARVPALGGSGPGGQASRTPAIWPSHHGEPRMRWGRITKEGVEIWLRLHRVAGCSRRNRVASLRWHQTNAILSAIAMKPASAASRIKSCRSTTSFRRMLMEVRRPE